MFEELALTATADALRAEGITSPRVALVAGSGLGGLAGLVESAVRVPYSGLPGAPSVSSVVGHAGEAIGGTLAGVPVVVFSGRFHGYQGVSALDAAFTARVSAALGASILIVTNATGSVNASITPGSIVLIEDQMNLTAQSPLTGWTGPLGGAPFIPMRDAYDPELRRLAADAASEQDIELRAGVYAGVVGPAFETPAEVHMLSAVGADIVGMSTVHEVIAARALGLRVLGLSLATNVAAGVGLSHEEVLERGAAAAVDMERLVLAILRRL